MARSNQIKFDGLSDAVNEILDGYIGDVTKVVNGAVDELCKDAPQIIANNSEFKGKKQKRSWRTQQSINTFGSKSAVIYSSDYRIPHLLENGHLTRQGTGRTQNTQIPKQGGKVKTKAFHYLEKSEKEINDKFIKAVEKAVKST